ncbi:MAG: hypothetical protein FWC39_07430 [Bacteroidetes bacterium]|nr:hypothetical protein [Bacteroidota bacterium]
MKTKLSTIVILMSMTISLFAQSTIKEVAECNLKGYVVIPSNETWVCNGTLQIADGTVIDGRGELVAKNGVTLNGAVEIKAISSVTFEGGLHLAKGAKLVNKGSLRMYGDVKMQETAKFYNHGASIIIGGSLIGVAGVTFSNEHDGVFQVCNAPGNTTKSVAFGVMGNAPKMGVGSNGVFFKEGSTFMCNNTDMNIFIDVLSTCMVAGTIDMIDSNLSFDCDNDNSRLLFSATTVVKVLDITAPYHDKGHLSVSLLSNRASMDIEGSVYATNFKGNYGSSETNKVNYCAGAVTVWFESKLNAFTDCQNAIVVKSNAGGSYEDFLDEAIEAQPVKITRVETTNNDIGHRAVKPQPQDDTILAGTE